MENVNWVNGYPFRYIAHFAKRGYGFILPSGRIVKVIEAHPAVCKILFCGSYHDKSQAVAIPTALLRPFSEWPRRRMRGTEDPMAEARQLGFTAI